MSENDLNDDQIKLEQVNMRLLQFLIEEPTYWNINQITQKTPGKTLKHARVRKSITYFHRKGFVKKFSDLPIDEQQQEKNSTNKETFDDSYKITQRGKEIFKKIMTSCLDFDSQRLLSLKKIE